MLKLLLDENLRSDALWQAIASQCATHHLLTAVKIQRVGGDDAPALGTPDHILLGKAAEDRCIIVSFDKSTLPNCFGEFLKTGRHSPGVLILRSGLTIPQIAELLIMISYAGDAVEFADQCNWIP